MTIVIAIDGPAGSGKGTIAKKISSFYNFPHLDSGILYRSVAYLCHKSGEKIFDEKSVLRHAQNLNLDNIDIDKLLKEYEGKDVDKSAFNDIMAGATKEEMTLEYFFPNKKSAKKNYAFI